VLLPRLVPGHADRFEMVDTLVQVGAGREEGGQWGLWGLHVESAIKPPIYRSASSATSLQYMPTEKP
jgi:hypothetical protein